MERRKAIFSSLYGLSWTLWDVSGRGFGAGEWTRTTDLLITNQLLCQLSCTGMAGTDAPAPHPTRVHRTPRRPHPTPAPTSPPLPWCTRTRVPEGCNSPLRAAVTARAGKPISAPNEVTDTRPSPPRAHRTRHHPPLPFGLPLGGPVGPNLGNCSCIALPRASMHSYEYFPLTCRQCGAPMELIALTYRDVLMPQEAGCRKRPSPPRPP